MERVEDFFPDGFDPSTASAEEVDRALSLLLAAANQGSLAANAILGYWYEIGFGVEVNEGRAVAYYETASSLGSQIAPHNLAMIRYRDGCFEEAFRCFRVAADRGEGQAMAMLGAMYESGTGIEQDVERAVHFYRMGAEARNADSILKLVTLYCRGMADGIGFAEARAMLESVLSDENSQGWFELGVLIASSQNDDGENAGESLRLIEKGAALGCEKALVWCGEAYSMGNGCVPDVAKGIFYLDQAIRNGSPRAKYVKAVLLARGNGVLGNSEQAFQLCHDAALAGEADAMNMLGSMLVRGHGTPADQLTGEAWIRRASSACYVEG